MSHNWSDITDPVHAKECSSRLIASWVPMWRIQYVMIFAAQVPVWRIEHDKILRHLVKFRHTGNNFYRRLRYKTYNYNTILHRLTPY